MGFQFGYSIAGGQDFNLDGYDDVVVGAPSYSNNTAAMRAGRIYIYPGGPTGITAYNSTSTGSGPSHQTGITVGVGRVDTLIAHPDHRYGDAVFGVPGAEDVNTDEGLVRIRVGRW